MRVVGYIAAAALSLAWTHADAASVFDSGSTPGQGFALFPFWQQVMSDMALAKPEPVALKTGAHPAGCAGERTCLPASWLGFLDTLRKQTRRQQLDAVNRFANARPYVEDIRNWGVADYWETPGEFFARGGDCEDYAIAKYFSLVRLGFSPDDLRIVVVNDTNLNAFHAVLSARIDGQTLLLDNQIPLVVPMDIAVQYKPVYALNEHGWWLYGPLKLNLTTATVSAGG